VGKLGPRCQAVLERPGFYPAGGGRLRVSIEPAKLQPLTLETRGQIRVHKAKAVVANVPVGIHLADQLVLLLALAGGGSFRTLPPSQHTRRQFAVIERFLGRKAIVEDEGTGAWRIAIT
jgi:RNA 3'-terminal phosphate cyclase